MKIRRFTLSVILLFLSAILFASNSQADPTPCPSPVAVFSENFDGVTLPMLPWGWAAGNAVDPDAILWVTSNSGVPMPVADSAPNAAFINDPATVSDKRLYSPNIPISNPFAQITFRNNYDLETTFDGGVLEISFGNDAYTDIIAAGGSFATGGYNATISTSFGNPIAGRMAWSGNSGGFITTTVNLPPAAAGNNVKFRWRMASDTSVAIQGWRIDGIAVLDCPPPPTPTPPAITVTLPRATFDNSVPIDTVIVLPVVTEFIDPSLQYSGFRGDFKFDSAIVDFADFPEAAGLTGTDWDVYGEIYDTGPGTMKTLSIDAHSLDGTPLNGAGTLFNLKMVRVSSTPGATSPLAWTEQGPFLFLTDTNLEVPASTPDGLITIGPGPTATPSPTTAPTPSSPTPAPPPVTVTLPTALFDNSVPIATVIIKPVVTTFIDRGLNYVCYQGDFTFDSAIVSFASPSVAAAGLSATNWNVSAGIINSGPGTMKILRVSSFSLDFTPMNGSGTLFNLRMRRVSSTPGAASPLVWKPYPDPDHFIFITPHLTTHDPDSTPSGLITITGPGQTINLSGLMSYCSNPSPGPVANVTLTLTGNASGSTLSDGAGSYQFSSLATGGSYIVTPAKSALPPGSSGIDTVDVLAIQRHFLQLAPLSGCRFKAADVNGDNSVNTVDVQASQQFFLGRTNGANTGTYQFNPASRTYPLAGSDQTGQNYDVLIVGDVAPSFADRPDGPSQEASGD